MGEASDSSAGYLPQAGHTLAAGETAGAAGDAATTASVAGDALAAGHALVASTAGATTLRELLPEASRRRWQPGRLADRPLELDDVLQRAQFMAAAMAANKLLNGVLKDNGQPVHSHLLDAVNACYVL